MSIIDGWFHEKEAMWPGQRFSLEVEKVLFNERSEFQDVLVFESKTYGKVLVLDGVIQITERDEFAYQEMLAHLPCFAHPNPKKVLVIGGGDGGIVREVAKHSCVETIHMCEIDPLVCDVSKKFGFSTATAFDDPRLTLIHEDAALYLLKEESGKYDVIIVDSSDPVGPAEVLFEPVFFSNLKKSLNDGGIISTQGECMWLHLDLIRKVMKSCSSLFESIDYAYASVPTYPCGQIGFMLLSNTERDISTPSRQPDINTANSLKYYSTLVHKNAFVLPKFAEDVVKDQRKRLV